MKLMIVRHGDPDYARDSLTEIGWEEAKCVAEYLKNMEIAAFYVSPLGRARDTASCTLKAMGRSGETKEWLREFAPRLFDPEIGRERPAWDWLPAIWTKEPRYYDREQWMHTEIMEAAKVPTEYRWVTESLDELLKTHGYCREGNYYRAESPNRDTIVLFCHFGLECVLLSHLLGVSPMVLWHGTCAAPCSITTLTTEERRPGIASFRMNRFGDISHLYGKGREPSFSARFCETYDNMEERHD